MPYQRLATARPVGDPRFYEREDELSALMEEIERATHARTPAVVELRGEAGMGKSRFLGEVKARLEGSSHGGPYVLWGEARSSASSVNPYQPFARALASLAAQHAPAEPIRRAFGALKEKYPAVLEAIPILGNALAALGELRQSYKASGEVAMPEDAHQAFLAFFRNIVDAGPSILLLDDMHWADPSSTDLLFELAVGVEDAPLLIVVAFRPNDLEQAGTTHPLRMALDRITRYERMAGCLTLEPLGDDAMASMVQDLVGGQAPPHSLMRWIAAQTEGNPHFVVQYASLLLEKGLLEASRSDRELYEATAKARESAIPPGVGAVIAERMHLLGEHTTEYRVLQVAAVLGETFSASDIGVVGRIEDREAEGALRQACQRFGLLQPADGACYCFFHGLVRDYLLQNLRQVDETDYRSLCAARLAHLEAAMRTDQLHLLAYFAREAEDKAKSAQYAMAAADHAAKIGALVEGEELARWAIESADRLDSPSARIDARRVFGTLAQALRRIDDALIALEDAHDLAAQEEIPIDTRVALQLELAKARRMRHRWAEAKAALAEVDDVITRARPDQQAQYWALLGEVHLCGAPQNLSLAHSALERAANSQELTPTLLTSVLGHLSLARLARSELAPADAAMDEAMDVALAAGHPRALFEANLFSGFVHVMRLRLEEARAAVDRLKALAQEHSISSADIPKLQCRCAALDGAFDEAATAYIEYLYQSTTPGSAFTVLRLQLEELADVLGAGHGDVYVDRVVQRLYHADGDPPLPEVAEITDRIKGARGNRELKAIVRSAIERYGHSRDEGRSFRHHVTDSLADWRRRHSVGGTTAPAAPQVTPRSPRADDATS